MSRSDEARDLLNEYADALREYERPLAKDEKLRSVPPAAQNCALIGKNDRPLFQAQARVYRLAKILAPLLAGDAEADVLLRPARSHRLADVQAALQKLGKTAARTPLSPHATRIYDLLLKLPPHRGMIGRSILDALAKDGTILDESTFYGRVLSELKNWGVLNKPRIGYYIPADARPKT